ncbi:hypothetical protein, partial [Methanoregula sp.]|uniref:hypothetical protein n=1 Tax=Methanoregula sp. TaxID=2052170 RepID=UPI000CC091E9
MLIQQGKRHLPVRAPAVNTDNGLVFFKKCARPGNIGHELPECAEIRIHCHIPISKQDAARPELPVLRAPGKNGACGGTGMETELGAPGSHPHRTNRS